MYLVGHTRFKASGLVTTGGQVRSNNGSMHLELAYLSESRPICIAHADMALECLARVRECGIDRGTSSLCHAIWKMAGCWTSCGADNRVQVFRYHHAIAGRKQISSLLTDSHNRQGGSDKEWHHAAAIRRIPSGASVIIGRWWQQITTVFGNACTA